LKGVEEWLHLFILVASYLGLWTRTHWIWKVWWHFTRTQNISKNSS